ncbi:MAG TPA: hypothetical protein VLM89_00165 [Phycisphaerae bacterium]|nr:hypothetical protein [Phycisphaerae bacterium]
MIRVLCPHCKRCYRTVTEVMGRQAVCHNCHITFVIGQERPPFTWKPTDLAEDSWIGVEPPREKPELRHCIICEAPLKPGTVRCPECGANQVTGVVRRGKTPDTPKPQTSLWHLIPWRYLTIALAVTAVGFGTYWAISAFHRQAAAVGDELLDQNLVSKAARFLRDTGDEYDFARQFAGQITDENLTRFVPRLSARDPTIRKASVLLIGHGRFSRLQPIVDAAGDSETAQAAREVFQAIGPRRLAELSCDADEVVRAAAADALMILFDLPGGGQTRRQLGEPGSAERKVEILNGLCRPWPEAVGTFQAVIDDRRSPMLFLLEQVGRVFYMNIGMMEFRSTLDGSRVFEIPVEHWCAATGQAVDVVRLRQIIAGSVVLESPYGADWSGRVRLIVKQPLLTELPGFLPFPLPDRGQMAEVPIRLERTGR